MGLSTIFQQIADSYASLDPGRVNNELLNFYSGYFRHLADPRIVDYDLDGVLGECISQEPQPLLEQTWQSTLDALTDLDLERVVSYTRARAQLLGPLFEDCMELAEFQDALTRYNHFKWQGVDTETMAARYEDDQDRYDTLFQKVGVLANQGNYYTAGEALLEAIADLFGVDIEEPIDMLKLPTGEKFNL